jgi:predicted TIM-barrel fold metal-dependent hydrolase
MAISRRALLGAVASGVPFLTSSCASISDYTISKRNCEPLDDLGMPVRGKGKPIRIDMHCHLLNLHDIDEASFLVEREFNLDENASLLFAELVRSLANKLGHLLEGTALDIGDERGHLDFELGKLNSDPRNRPAWASDGDFCAYASSNQRGQNFRAERLGFQLTGVFSNRIRNAARLMALFPKVDIFTPSMVDLFEDEPKYLKDLENRIARPHQISTQINFYSNLNLATNGRFLPLVSFNPARQYVMELQGLEEDYFFWIKRAISDLGFIGVKVHPSYGFSPHNNLRYACFNARRGIPTPSDQDLHKRFLRYDDHMQRLFSICKKYNVPILTHSGESISQNRTCMEGEYSNDVRLHGNRYKHYTKKPTGENGDRSKGEWTYAFRGRSKAEPRDESDWTNSPKAWLAAMEKADKAAPHHPGLRVCLAHFANGFKDPNRRQQKKSTKNVEISAWLADAMKADNENLYTDVSIMGELFAKGVFHNRKLRQKRRDLFAYVLKQDNALADNTMYGTDWHMPTAAIVGDRYYTEMEALIEETRGSEYADAVMGENAVRFFGLGKHEPGTNNNRYRLASFYKHAPDLKRLPRDGSRIINSNNGSPAGYRQDYSVDLSKIDWWHKV